MKKDMVKGVLIGVCLTLAAGVSIPAAAKALNVNITVNAFRFKTDKETVISWGEELTLSNGNHMASSIVYNGEAYVPVSMTSRLFGKSLLWNGDSSTYTISDSRSEYSAIKNMTTKKDINGNNWSYYITNTKDSSTYLLVEDTDRGYARAYMLAGASAYEFNKDCVYFAKLLNADKQGYGGLALTKLSYANNPDNQDGEEILRVPQFSRYYFSDPIIVEGVLYFVYHNNNNPAGTSVTQSIRAVNCEDVKQEFDLCSFTGNATASGYGTVSISGVNYGYLYFNITYSDNGGIQYYKIKTDGTEGPIRL